MMPHRSLLMEGEETVQLFGLWRTEPSGFKCQKAARAKTSERCSTDKQRSRKWKYKVNFYKYLCWVQGNSSSSRRQQEYNVELRWFCCPLDGKILSIMKYVIKHYLDPRALGAFLFVTVLLGLFHLVGFKKLKWKKKEQEWQITLTNVALLVLILTESPDKHSKKPKEEKFFRFHPVTTFFTENLDKLFWFQ